MGYVKSKSIKVYPTGFRGYTTDADNNIQVFDPESMLSVEDNVTRPYKALSDYGGFVCAESVISAEDTDVFQFIYKGYFFSIQGIQNYFPESGDKVYAHIIVKAKSGTIDANNQSYVANSLSPIDSADQDNLDTTTGSLAKADTFDFKGLKLNNNSVNNSVEGLLIAEKVGDSWVIPEHCKLKFKTTSIKGGIDYTDGNKDISLDKQLDTKLVYASNGDGTGQLTLQGQQKVLIKTADKDADAAEYIKLDSDEGTVEINATKDGEGTIILHAAKDIIERVDANEKVTVEGDSTSTITGNKSIISKKKLTLESKATGTTTANNDVKITSAHDVDISASNDVDIDSQGSTKVTANDVTVSAMDSVNIKSQADECNIEADTNIDITSKKGDVYINSDAGCAHISAASTAGVEINADIKGSTSSLYFKKLTDADIGAIYPNANAKWDLGTVDNKFRNTYADGTLQSLKTAQGYLNINNADGLSLGVQPGKSIKLYVDVATPAKKIGPLVIERKEERDEEGAVDGYYGCLYPVFSGNIDEDKGWDLGTASTRFANIYANYLNVNHLTAPAVIYADVNLATCSILPTITNMYNVGSSEKKFKDLHVKNIHAENVYVDDYGLYKHRMQLILENKHTDATYMRFVFHIDVINECGESYYCYAENIEQGRQVSVAIEKETLVKMLAALDALCLESIGVRLTKDDGFADQAEAIDSYNYYRPASGDASTDFWNGTQAGQHYMPPFPSNNERLLGMKTSEGNHVKLRGCCVSKYTGHVDLQDDYLHLQYSSTGKLSINLYIKGFAAAGSTIGDIAIVDNNAINPRCTVRIYDNVSSFLKK